MIPSPSVWWLAAGLALGAILGSFLATLVIRWPQGRSVLAGRSRCDACGRALRPWDLVPILSYAVLHGRCRGCGAAIDRRHLLVEIAAAGIALSAFLAHGWPLGLISAFLGLGLLATILLDAEHHWLPDLLVLPLGAAGLAAALASFGPAIELRLLGAAIGFLGLAAIGYAYRRLRGREGLGGGDPKLLGALGAWIGAAMLPYVLLGAGLVGLAALTMMRLRGQKIEATTRLPLGSFLALATWPIWLIVAR